MSITLSALQKQRRDTAANWTSANPTLLAGEIGIESDTGYWKVGDGTTAWTSLAYISGLGAEIPVNRLADGSARQLLQTAANGTDVEWTSNVDVPGTLDVTGAATFDAAVTIQGNLTVNGTTTTIDTQHLIVEDKNVVIGQVTSPTDVTADGGGITLKGTTDKTINWVDATDAWTSSEHVNLASGKKYYINGTEVLSGSALGSGVTGSSLTSVGTISTGVWQGTAINKSYLDSTLVSTGDTGTVTSTMIANGTILNVDINASAAIAGTKISPDFGSQNVTTTGNITVNAQGDLRFGDSDSSNWVAFQAPGTVASNVTWTLPSADGTSDQVLKTNGAGTLSWGTAAGDKISEGNTEAEVVDTGTDGHFKVTTEGTERLRIDKDGNLLKGLTTARSNFIAAPGTIPTFQIEGTGNAAIGSITYYGNDTSGPAWGLAKSRGTTAGSSTTVIAGDSTGDIYFFGANGTTMQPTAQISSVVDSTGTVSSTSMPGALVFYTTPTGTNIPAQRLRISESGSIGIGVTPKSSANSAVSTLEIGRNTLRGGQTSFSIYQNGYWDASTGFDKRIFTGSATQYYQDTYFSWSTSGSGAADSTISFTERMRLDSNGNVGIGTNSPANYANFVTLALADTSGAEIDFLKGSTIQGSIYNAGDIFYIESKSTVPTAFVTNGSERMRLDSSGRLGLGTSSPSFAAHISAAKNTSQLFVGITGLSSVDDYAQIGFGTGSTAAGSIRLGFDNPAGVTNTYLGFYNNNGSSLGERMRIDSSGRVGIGTTSPGQLLEINGASNPCVLIKDTTNNVIAYTFADDNVANFGSASAHPVVFRINNNEAARIDTSSRLLVGTSTSRSGWFNSGTWGNPTLQVEGTSVFNSGISVTNNSNDDNGSQLILGKSRATSVGGVTVVSSGDNVGRISFHGADGTELVAAATIEAAVDGTPGANDMPGRLVFSTTADGASSPTERMRITSGGFFKASNTGSYFGSTGTYHEIRSDVNGSDSLLVSNSNSSGPIGVGIYYTAASPNGTGNNFVNCEDSTTRRAAIRSNGGLANFSANNVNLSDINAKKDIAPAAGTWDCLKEWEIVNFRYKDQPDDADLNMGVIAQQVAESCPEVITVFQEATEDQPEKLGVKDQQMMWMAIKALQEAQLRIETLEAKVAALEAS